MVKRIIVKIVAVLVLIVGAVYLSIRTMRIQHVFPDNVVLSALPSHDHREAVDSVLVKATDMYMAGLYRKIMLGENYRKAWDAPIKVPVLWLDTLNGGLKPIKAGGGAQSRSLRLADSMGHWYTLRSVCKDASSNSKIFKVKYKLKNIAIDGISAGHPYAALPAASLCESAGLLHTHPRLVFLPEQPVLDTFNQRFANRLYTLEYEPKGKNTDWTGIGNATKLMESEDFVKKLMQDPLHRPDQATLLRSRFLDLLIGDWDRHGGNWGWVAHPENEQIVYTPFPADRDMAFYNAGGVVTRLFDRPGTRGQIRSLFQKHDYLSVTYSKYFDPFFLNEMTREDFMQAASTLQRKLTDEVIREAFHTWPDTVFNLNAPELIDNFIAHRNDLPKYAKMHYEALARHPQVMGTHQVDSFLVEQIGINQVKVEVYSTSKTGCLVKKYGRTFIKGETMDISLFGWANDDVLEVRGNLCIPINFVGGEGNDRLLPTSVLQETLTLVDAHNGMKLPNGYMLQNMAIKPLMPKH